MNLIERAKELDQKFKIFNSIAEKVETGDGELGGIAVSVKDNICVKGMESRAGSKILEGYIPPFDATVVARCRAEGAFIIGKTSQDEFGFGTFNVNTPYSVPLNPHDTERSAGGSSGGGAVLTAVADFPHVAIAESTGGSISCPASWCGVVGITPTYGRTSRWGLIDYANSLDKIGCMGKTVREAAMLLSVISGHDRYDSTVLREPVPDFTSYIDEPIEGMKIGVPHEYFGEGVDEEVSETVRKTLDCLEQEGAKILEVSLPFTKYSLSSYYIIAMAEASTNLAKLCGMRYGLQPELEGNFDEYFSKVRGEGFGDEAKRRIILGTYARLAGYRDEYYLKALKVRTKVIEDFKKAFKEIDVLAAPTMPVVAPRFDEVEEMEPIQHYMMDILTVAPNLAGIPMISVPCGEVEGLPVGLHLMGDHLSEGKIIQAASRVGVR
ncbi:Asp-tRNA(Asn)/Glu-tRNA(Gln) amidotransferase subunit GatA [Candidatus Bathyarchaeota archaeon]|nr:Asp-tRNA(Asn)/Glu-tRNA(Gln) amidotransferase subunit GatA [Candidatus Bathyarchaeota archaeon]